MTISADIYEDSRLDADARARLEASYSFLHRPPNGMPEKVAAGGLKNELLQTALSGAMGGAGLFAAGAAGHGLVEGAKALKEKVSRGSDLRNITSVYPELTDYPQREIDLAYNSLRHLNPHFAKDPLVGGTLLKQILRSRDPSNPQSLRFEGGLAVDLVKSQPRESDTLNRLAVDAFQTGFQDAMKRRDVLDERAWRESTDHAKRTADETFRSQQAKAERDFKAQQQAQQQAFTTATENLRMRAQKSRDLTAHRRAMDMQRAKDRGTAQTEVLKARLRGTQEPEVLNLRTGPGGTAHAQMGPPSPSSLATSIRQGGGPLSDLLR
jgi:hypothetical protein